MTALLLAVVLVAEPQIGKKYEVTGTLSVEQLGRFWNAYVDIPDKKDKVITYRLDLLEIEDYKKLEAKIGGKKVQATASGIYTEDGFRRVLRLLDLDQILIHPQKPASK